MRKEVPSIIKEAAIKVAEDLKVEIVDIETKKESKGKTITVYIHKEGGVQISDCQGFSAALDAELELMNFINTPWYLEVSSPGLDRPLKTDDDFRRNINEILVFNLFKSLKGKKQIIGKIKKYDNDIILIEDKKGNEIYVNRKDISLIKILIEF